MMLLLNGRRILPALLLALLQILVISGAAIGPAEFAQASLTPAARALPETEIRVRINEGSSVVEVHGFDLRITGNGGARGPATVAERESEWEFRCQDGRIRARKMSGDEVGESSMDLPEPVVVRSPAGFLRYKGKPYREELEIFSAGSLCEVVNQVDLEKYLEGLVNAEFSSRWNEESIGAQVVAARTYALFQIRQARALADVAGEEAHYDIDASTHDQVYDGSMKEDPRAARIVEKTRGWILTVRTPKGKVTPLKAYYSSTCGGMTELPHAVWGTSDAGFRRVNCPFCAHSPAAHWNFDLSASQITDALKRASRGDTADLARWPKDWKQLLSQGKLRGIRVLSYDASGRVEEIALSFAIGRGTQDWSMSGARFRQWVGPAQFKSTSFQLQLVSNDGRKFAWRFSGRGNGHGVGMCQWGAKTMGERGFKTAAILKYYYPDAQLRKIW